MLSFKLDSKVLFLVENNQGQLVTNILDMTDDATISLPDGSCVVEHVKALRFYIEEILTTNGTTIDLDRLYADRENIRARTVLAREHAELQQKIQNEQLRREVEEMRAHVDGSPLLYMEPRGKKQ